MVSRNRAISRNKLLYLCTYLSPTLQTHTLLHILFMCLGLFVCEEGKKTLRKEDGRTTASFCPNLPPTLSGKASETILIFRFCLLKMWVLARGLALGSVCPQGKPMGKKKKKSVSAEKDGWNPKPMSSFESLWWTGLLSLFLKPSKDVYNGIRGCPSVFHKSKQNKTVSLRWRVFFNVFLFVSVCLKGV